MEVNVKTGTFVRFWLVILGFAAVAGLIFMARWGITLVFVSMFLAIALNPFVTNIMRRLPRIGRTFATAISYSVLVIAVGLVLALLVPVAIQQIMRLAEIIPGALEHSTESWAGVSNFIEVNGLEPLRDQIFSTLDGISANIINYLGSNFLSGAFGVARFIFDSLLVLVLTFLFLNSGPALYEGFYKRLKKTKRVEKIHHVLMRMRLTISQFMMGQLVIAIIDSMVVTVIIFVLCMIFGMDLSFALPLGLFAGAMTMVPMFGAMIATVIITLILLFSSIPAAIIFAIAFIVYQQIENNIVALRVQSKHSQLPALVVLVAIVIGTSISGLLGAIVSIPIAGCIKILLDEYLFKPEKHKLDEELRDGI